MGERAHLVRRVVHAGDDEAGDLQVAGGGVGEVGDGGLDLGEVAAHETVGLLAEGLEVDVGGVDEGRHLADDALAEAPVRDEHVREALREGELRRVAHVLPAHEGLVVGVGDAHHLGVALALGEGERHEVGRHHLPPGNVALAALGDAVGAHREHPRARLEAGERLLLDGVDRDGGEASVVVVDDGAVALAAAAAGPEGVFGKRAVARARRADRRVFARWDQPQVAGAHRWRSTVKRSTEKVSPS